MQQLLQKTFYWEEYIKLKEYRVKDYFLDYASAVDRKVSE